MTLKTGLEVKVIETGAIQKLSYSPSMAVSVAVCEIFGIKEWCDLENGVIGFVQGHWKWHYLIDRIRVPIHLS